MSEDQQQPQSEQPEPQVKPIAASQKAAKTSNSSAAKIEPQKVLLSLLDKFGSAWQGLVGLVRSRLPASMNEKLSDTILNAAIAAIIIVAIGTILTILPGKSPETVVASSPESTEITVSPSPESTEITVSPSPESTEITVSPSPESTAANLPEAVAAEEVKPAEVIPPPPPKLTPEQQLIAKIQKQVAEITNQLGGSLIQSIQVNFPSSLLTVKVADDWYNVGTDEQDKLVSKMFQQTQELEFKKLEITNSEGKLIARSPVIGSEMIILERHKSKIIGNS
ncbi:hypothetical protein BCD67_14360 [Oscillatoriales cyanobacterium USR001]|nr:hypothetical protein BCD67_14360 [Oscillatoriales cyanobacterium USR001]